MLRPVIVVWVFDQEEGGELVLGGSRSLAWTVYDVSRLVTRYSYPQRWFILQSGRGCVRKLGWPKVEAPQAAGRDAKNGGSRGLSWARESGLSVSGLSGLTTGEAAGVSCEVAVAAGAASVSVAVVSEDCPAS